MNWIERAHAALGKLLVIKRINTLETQVLALSERLAALENGNIPVRCPACGSDNVEMGNEVVIAGEARRPCRCLEKRCMMRFTIKA